METSTTFDRAMELRRQGKLAEALPLFLAAIREDPLNPEPWYKAARTALKLNRYGHAAQLYESCLRFAPTHVGAANGLWYARLCVGDFEGSLVACRRALELDPGNIESLNMLGNLSYVLGRPAEGREAHMRALALEEQAPARNWTCATVRLVHGDFARGWQYFEPGAAGAQPGRQIWAPPKDRVWRGEEVKGRTVCIYKNGGNGDVFLFARYVPLVASRVGRVVMTAPDTHDRLLASLGGLSAVHRHPTEAGDDALFTHLWALPGIFGTMPDSVPNAVPYLHPPASGPVLPPSNRLRVGLAWAGHPNTPINYDRSIPSAELLGRLVGIPGIDWVALQVGFRAEFGDGLPFAARPTLADFGDTAFVLRQLDLLVTVDTAIANLAGALGVPAWVMVPTYPEFRWGTEGEATPWYPGLRLFRRANTAEWEGVISRVAAALGERVATTGERNGRAELRTF